MGQWHEVRMSPLWSDFGAERDPALYTNTIKDKSTNTNTSTNTITGYSLLGHTYSLSTLLKVHLYFRLHSQTGWNLKTSVRNTQSTIRNPSVSQYPNKSAIHN